MTYHDMKHSITIGLMEQVAQSRLKEAEVHIAAMRLALAVEDMAGATVATELANIANLNFPTNKYGHRARDAIRELQADPASASVFTLGYDDKKVAESIGVIGKARQQNTLDFLHTVIRSNGTGDEISANSTVRAAIRAVNDIHSTEARNARELVARLESERAALAFIKGSTGTSENKVHAIELLGAIGNTDSLPALRDIIGAEMTSQNIVMQIQAVKAVSAIEDRVRASRASISQPPSSAREVLGEHTQKAAGERGGVYHSL